MSRDIHAATAAAMQAQDVRLAVFFEGQFASGFLRLWTGIGDISWNGHTWTGAGSLIGMSEISETEDVVASGVAVSLSGVPSDLVQIAIDEARQGMPGRVWLALFDANIDFIGEPVPAFAGRLDVPEITDDAETCTISISYESRLVDLNASREWRYTHESQQVLFPGDRGFDYVTKIQDKEVVWGPR
jgi:hypothetical protein